MNRSRFLRTRLHCLFMLLAVSAGAVLPAATVRARGAHPMHPSGAGSRQAFHDDMRKLWEDHITWTRGFIVSVAHDLPDASPTLARLLQNQVDIGDAFKPFYGDRVGNRLTALLQTHIAIAGDILTAAKAGDAAGVADGRARWSVNADEIATFWNAINPRNWELAEMKMMMQEHLALTLEEAVARLTGDFAADIAAYEKVHLAILDMADQLSDGIIRQFPRKFH